MTSLTDLKVTQKDMNMEEAFEMLNLQNRFHHFYVDKDYNFEETKLTEANVKPPFETISMHFEKPVDVNGIMMHDIQMVADQGIYVVKFFWSVSEERFRDDKEKALSKVPSSLHTIISKVWDKKLGEDLKPFLNYYYVNFKITDEMELVIEDTTTELGGSYVEKYGQEVFDLGFFKMMHQVMQVIAWINTNKPEIKLVEKNGVKETKSGVRTGVSKFIYISKRAISQMKLKTTETKRQFTKPLFAYPVRGHVRVLKHEKYKVPNKEIYIHNYVKNKDKELFINKKYIIK